MDEPISHKSGLARRIATGLREARRMRGLTRRELSQRAGVHWTFLEKIERHSVTIYPHVLRRVAIALDVSPDDLMNGDIVAWPVSAD